MDALSSIFDNLRLNSSYYYRASFKGSWGVNIPNDQKMARFHIVVDGFFWLQTHEKERIKVSKGDIVIVFNGLDHKMKSEEFIEVMEANNFIENSVEFKQGEILRYDKGEGTLTNIICGHFCFESRATHPLLKSLPDVLHIKKEENTHAPWLDTLLDFVDFESNNLLPGSNAVIRRMSEVIFIQAIRSFISRNLENRFFLSLLGDAQIARSLDAFHQDIAKKWTIEGLAKESGLSRTIYSKRFKELSDSTPVEYMTNVRIGVAKEELLRTQKSVDEIAVNLGYQASEHFQKLFKKVTGLTPSQYRKRSTS